MQMQGAAGAVNARAFVTVTLVVDLESQVIIYRGGGAGTQTATASPSSSFGSDSRRRRRLQLASAVQVSYVVLLPPGTPVNETGFVRALLKPFVQGQQSPPGFELFTATTIQNLVAYAAAAGAADLSSSFAGATLAVAAPAYVPPRSIPSTVAPAGIVAKTVGGILGGVVLLLFLRQLYCPGRARPKLTLEPKDPLPTLPEHLHGAALKLRVVLISSPQTRASAAAALDAALHTSEVAVGLAPSRRGSSAALAAAPSASRRGSAGAAPYSISRRESSAAAPSTVGAIWV